MFMVLDLVIQQYIRGSSTTFDLDAVSPDWEEYATSVRRAWKYIQIKIIVAG